MKMTKGSPHPNILYKAGQSQNGAANQIAYKAPTEIERTHLSKEQIKQEKKKHDNKRRRENKRVKELNLIATTICDKNTKSNIINNTWSDVISNAHNFRMENSRQIKSGRVCQSENNICSETVAKNSPSNKRILETNKAEVTVKKSKRKLKFIKENQTEFNKAMSRANKTFNDEGGMDFGRRTTPYSRPPNVNQRNDRHRSFIEDIAPGGIIRCGPTDEGYEDHEETIPLLNDSFPLDVQQLSQVGEEILDLVVAEGTQADGVRRMPVEMDFLADGYKTQTY